MKMPAFQFYPADWRKDPGIQALDRHDRSVWFDMLCIMHESDERGVLLLAGRPMPHAALSRMLAMDEAGCQQTVDRLLEYGVVSRREDGALYSRRMVKDEALRQARAKGGESGAEHGVKGKKYGAKGGRPKNKTGDNKPPLLPPLNPPPSSSSSSSITSDDVTPPPPAEDEGQGNSPPPAALPANPAKQMAVATTDPAEEQHWKVGPLTKPKAFRVICERLGFLEIDFEHYRKQALVAAEDANVSRTIAQWTSWVRNYLNNQTAKGPLLKAAVVDLSRPTPRHEMPPEGSDCTGKHIVLPNNGDANLNRIAAQTYAKSFPNATIHHTRP